MANIFPSFTLVHPSYTMPEAVLQYSQASGAFALLAGGDPMVRIGSEDKYVYVKVLQMRSKVAAGQHAANQLPSCTIAASMVSTPTYLFRCRAEYDHHDIAAGSTWGASVPEAQRLSMRQGHFQGARNAELYGLNPQNGEGIVNSQGATALNLPPDTNGNDTVGTYDNGQLAQFLLAQVAAAKTRCLQLGLPVRVEIVAPQRILSQMEYQGIVQLTSYQRAGAGTTTIRGNVEDVLEMNGDSLGWGYDDTLIGQGSGGADLLVMTIPEIKTPVGKTLNTNVFAELQPNTHATVLQLCDMAAPREIPTPMPGGAIDVVTEWRLTSGWGLRPEAITLISLNP